jgi:hypothetical protein
MLPLSAIGAGKDQVMHLDEQTFGDFKIYAAASPAPGSGFFAGVAVHRLRGPNNPPEQLYFDKALYGGSVFTCPDTALRHAMTRGCQALDDIKTKSGG